MESVSQKRCSKCGEWKERSEFNRNKAHKDGLNNWCKSCSRAGDKKYRIEHPDHFREWYKNNRDRAIYLVRRWRASNPDKAKIDYDRLSLWFSAHPEERNKKFKRWIKAHPGINQERRRSRRAKKKGNGGVITAKEWAALKAKYNYTCLRCGQVEPVIKLTLDHVLPLALGGRNVIENAQPLCLSCNSSKGAKFIDYR